MAEVKANIGTAKKPYFIEEGTLVYDLRTSMVRKVEKIIYDPNHQPQFHVFLDVDLADLDGNGRELVELSKAEVELGCARCDTQLMALGDPNHSYLCGRCEREVENGSDDDDDCGHLECGLRCEFYDEPMKEE